MPRYRSNWRWKYSTVASIAKAVKVAIVISQSVVVFGVDNALIKGEIANTLLNLPMVFKCDE